MLLRKVRPEEHPNLDLARRNSRETCSNRRHQLLGGEAIVDSLDHLRPYRMSINWPNDRTA